jgi:hypothetical protein
MSSILNSYEIFGSRGLPKCFAIKNQGKNQMCEIDWCLDEILIEQVIFKKWFVKNYVNKLFKIIIIHIFTAILMSIVYRWYKHWERHYGNMSYKKNGTNAIGTCIYHGW